MGEKRTSFPALTYLKDKLARWPATRSHYGFVTYGPLTVYATRSKQPSSLRKRYLERELPEGHAAAAILRANENPQNSEAQMVLMTVESLAQIMTWLMEADPDNFVRVKRNRKDTDG